MWNNRARSNIEIFQIDSEMERATYVTSWVVLTFHLDLNLKKETEQ
jgi:hypothetical protein